MLADDKTPKSEVVSLVFDVYKQMLKNRGKAIWQ